MSNASSRYAATDENLRKHALAPAMRWLVATALDGATATYGELKRHLEDDAGFSTIFATRIGMVAGELMHRLHEVQPSAPLINVLVVNQRDRLPSKGAGWFMAKRFSEDKLKSSAFKRENTEEWREFFNRAASEVYAYSGEQWSDLYEKAFGQTLEEADISQYRDNRRDGNEDDFGGGEKKYGAGGESDAHRALRLWINENPDKVGVGFKALRAETEFCLDSGDRVDVVYHLDDSVVVLEVKSRISNEIDYRRGVYQCIKYRAVKSAMDLRNDDSVRAVLVTENEIPGEIKDLLRIHKIAYFRAPLDR